MKIINWIKEHYWLAAIMVVASFLRFYKADYQSLWLDEVLTMNDANPNLTWSEFYRSVVTWEAFPHLYFLLVKVFMAIFGFTTLAARIFSAIIGIVGVYGMYLLGREIFNRRVGLFSAALVAVNSLHLFYSQEVRPYGMLFLFTVFSFYRLIIFLRRPSFRNAIYYGIFSGLIVNSHFFGLLTLFSQFLIIIYFVVRTPNERRREFIKYALTAGGIGFLLILPTAEPLRQVMRIKSFWIPKPTPDTFTLMFKEFFGNSELLIFVATFVGIYYVLQVFRQKVDSQSPERIIGNRLVFSFMILSSWILTTLVISIVKSYLDVSMILTRYFINVLPVFIIAIAIGIAQIKNQIAKNIVVAALIIFSLIDIFVVKDYYNTPQKSQLRELAADMKAKNTDNTKFVVYFDWIFPFYFQDRKDIRIEGRTLEAHVQGIRNKTIAEEPFWFGDVHPFELNPDDNAYLTEHFNITDKIEYREAWAYKYTPKNYLPSQNRLAEFNLASLKRMTLENDGSLRLRRNTSTYSDVVGLEKGVYELKISASSFPSPPIDNTNGHIKIKLNDDVIADYYPSDKPSEKEKTFTYNNTKFDDGKFQVIFDNDYGNGKDDRDVVIYSIGFHKK